VCVLCRTHLSAPNGSHRLFAHPIFPTYISEQMFPCSYDALVAQRPSARLCWRSPWFASSPGKYELFPFFQKRTERGRCGRKMGCSSLGGGCPPSTPLGRGRYLARWWMGTPLNTFGLEVGRYLARWAWPPRGAEPQGIR